MKLQHQFVLDTLDTLKREDGITRVLNVGYRPSSSPFALKWCGDHEVAFDVVEINKRNADWASKIGLTVTQADVRDLSGHDLWCDFVLWLHGPEHVRWSEFLAVRKTLEHLSRRGVLYQAPLGVCPVNPRFYGNPAEAHLEHLTPHLFTRLGYVTVIHEGPTDRCFSAVTIKPHRG